MRTSVCFISVGVDDQDQHRINSYEQTSMVWPSQATTAFLSYLSTMSQSGFPWSETTSFVNKNSIACIIYAIAGNTTGTPISVHLCPLASRMCTHLAVVLCSSQDCVIVGSSSSGGGTGGGRLGLLGIVQAWVAHFVTPLKCIYDKYNWQVSSQKPHKNHRSPNKHDHHGCEATRPSSGVNLMNPRCLRGGWPCACLFQFRCRSHLIDSIN